eukprot:4689950-Pyramimonas_sp.AAC.1
MGHQLSLTNDIELNLGQEQDEEDEETAAGIGGGSIGGCEVGATGNIFGDTLSLIHISEPTRPEPI